MNDAALDFSPGRGDARAAQLRDPGPVAQPAQAAAADAAAKHERIAWRSWVPWTLVVVAAAIGLVAGLNVWVKRQALNTDNFTNASAHMLENDKIRSALSVYLVNELYSNVNVSQTLQQRLPPTLDPLAPEIAAGLKPVATRAADALLGRPRVQQLFRDAVRRAHELFMAVINGKKGILVSTNGNVVLDLGALIQQLANQTGLGARLAERLPPGAGQITILKGNQLKTARDTVKVVRVLSYLLFFLVIAIYAAAVYLARKRRTLLMGIGVSVLLIGLIILVVRRFAGSYLVDALTTGNVDTKSAVSAAWAIETQLLRNVGVNAVIYGISIMFAAWIAGGSRSATWVRRVLAPTMRDRPLVLYGAVTLVLLLILLAGPTDAQRIFPLLILFAFAYVGTVILRRQTLREFPAEPAAQQAAA